MTNYKTHIFILCLSVGLSTFLPSAVFPLAGIGEVDSTFHFNRYAKLKWAHPGDTCEGGDNYCLKLEKANRGTFKGLDCSLEEINLPENTSIPIILARRSTDNTWLVYDLANEAFIIEAATFDDATAEWNSRALPVLSLIDTSNPDQFLSETYASIKRKWSLRAFYFFPPCLLLSVVFGGLAVVFHKKYSQSGLKEKLGFSIVFTILFGVTIICLSVFVWAMR